MVFAFCESDGALRWQAGDIYGRGLNDFGVGNDTGPIFGFSDTWQLVINTGTTIITFLMVLLHSKHAEKSNNSEAMQVKLDELIRVTKGAQNALLDLEELEEEELDVIRDKYEKIAERARGEFRKEESEKKAGKRA